MCRNTTVILACLLSLLSALAARADTLRVPEDYPTLQSAADNSSSGDIIDLAPGTWHQHVWGLSGVTLKGREGAASTIIDGSAQGLSPVVIYGNPCTIEGITFRNGTGSDIFGIIRGGAIYSEFTPVEIANCRFEENSVDIGKFSDAIGGAICSYYAPLSISNCEFVRNTASSGGAVYITHASDLQLQNCRFRGNAAWQGGAIYIEQTPFMISSSLFHDNFASAQGGGIFVDAPGPGSDPFPGTLQGIDFIRNSASDYGFGAGGGLAVLGNHAVETIDCTFQDNYGYTGGGILAGVLADGDTPLPVSGTLFCGNFFDDYSYEGIDDDGSNTFNQNCWCSADIDANEIIDVNDLLLLLNAWGGFFHPDFDANNDNAFDVNDILAVVEAWGRDCYDDT